MTPRLRDLLHGDAERASRAYLAIVDAIADGDQPVTPEFAREVASLALDGVTTSPVNPVLLLIEALSYGDDTWVLAVPPDEVRMELEPFAPALAILRKVLFEVGPDPCADPRWPAAFAYAAALLPGDVESLRHLERLRDSADARVADTASVSTAVRAYLGDSPALLSPRPRLASTVERSLLESHVSEDSLLATVLPYEGAWASGPGGGDLVWFRVLAATARRLAGEGRRDAERSILDFMPESTRALAADLEGDVAVSGGR